MSILISTAGELTLPVCDRLRFEVMNIGLRKLAVMLTVRGVRA